MKVNKIHLAIIFVLVLMLFSFKPLDLNPTFSNANNFTSSLEIIHTKYSFINIFLSNLIVGLILSVVGFFTGDLMTLLTILWNLLIVWIIYSNAFSGNNNIQAILYFSKHAPLEIYSFALFSIIGFSGFKFYRKLIVYQEFDVKLFPNVKEIIIPIILLLIASLIEVYK